MTFFAGDDLAAVDLNGPFDALLGGKSYLITTSLSPLTSTANAAAQILSGSYDFKGGYAYEISFNLRYTFGGFTATATAEPRATFGLRRANAAGTLIYQGGYVNASDTADFHTNQSMVVKVSADTTQTVSLTGQFSTTAGATSLAIPASTTQPARMTIRCVGLAANNASCLELPTS